jgi:hypothetical protein
MRIGERANRPACRSASSAAPRPASTCSCGTDPEPARAASRSVVIQLSWPRGNRVSRSAGSDPSAAFRGCGTYCANVAIYCSRRGTIPERLPRVRVEDTGNPRHRLMVTRPACLVVPCLRTVREVKGWR